MMFAVVFEDDPDKAEMRGRHMADHLAFLERCSERIKAAGPLADGATGEAAGGLWLVEADDAHTVRDLVEADPFWPTGLRRSVRVLQWRQVFRDGQRLT